MYKRRGGLDTAKPCWRTSRRSCSSYWYTLPASLMTSQCNNVSLNDGDTNTRRYGSTFCVAAGASEVLYQHLTLWYMATTNTAQYMARVPRPTLLPAVDCRLGKCTGSRAHMLAWQHPPSQTAWCHPAPSPRELLAPLTQRCRTVPSPLSMSLPGQHPQTLRLRMDMSTPNLTGIWAVPLLAKLSHQPGGNKEDLPALLHQGNKIEAELHT